MKNFFSRFRTLQWKLTLSYTWVTTAVAAAVFLIIFLIAASVIGLFIPDVATAFQPVLRPVNAQIAEFLAQDPPNLDGLRAWLDSSQQGDEFQVESSSGVGVSNVRFSDVLFAAVVDPAGNLLALEPGDNLSQPVAALLFEEALPAYEQALLGESDPELVTAVHPETNDIFVAVPSFGADQELLGVFFLVMDLPSGNSDVFTANTILGILPLLFIIFALAGGVGTIFGFIASRSFSRRLRQLGQTAESWSQGDFSAYVQDESGDEIGQLARRLNQMAEQLQNLVQTRAELATLEERNRLARDLHDSVKQQVFATAMQLGAAQTMLESDLATAKTHLQEAEQLARQAQQELTGLIQELRPAALEGKGLGEALRGYAADWSRRTSIAADVKISGERPLPLQVEQPLFRVAQEALANVARHSGANRVTLHLAWQDDTFTMTISDDGQGFDTEATAYGLGLSSMQERLAAVNGRLATHSMPGQGTQLTATVPLQS
ncbi:histidine kinase [Candidatus Leptofilum sp.]|uniref:HAMP domain-containing sensor histidine kinase n=1 Tax=Candidatus Leptofilum sp. TaxID=3241576 RepID=UPI003B5B9777